MSTLWEKKNKQRHFWARRKLFVWTFSVSSLFPVIQAPDNPDITDSKLEENSQRGFFSSALLSGWKPLGIVGEWGIWGQKAKVSKWGKPQVASFLNWRSWKWNKSREEKFNTFVVRFLIRRIIENCWELLKNYLRTASLQPCPIYNTSSIFDQSLMCFPSEQITQSVGTIFTSCFHYLLKRVHLKDSGAKVFLWIYHLEKSG